MLPLSKVLLAGMGAGIINSIVICPLDRIKILLQLQGQPFQITEHRGTFALYLSSTKPYLHFEGPLDVARQVGLFGLYKGALATVLREMVGLGTYFFTYESLKRLLTREGESASIGNMLLAGGITGMTTWTLNFPFDTIKSRIQAQHKATEEAKRIVPVLKELYTTGGVKIFFKGWTPAILRAFPVHATILAVYELALKLLSGMGE